ncbi:MAG TPA: NAD(P)H-dependent glycerol-3-phosphate dehydrogenase [Acidobacteriota bacterium]|nr:NAD(P)H-dependent glycerol-3-phosphate dehydrogenase [Acidobacteriota bacterium]
MNKTVAVIGAGSWGTALAVHAASIGHRVRLWVHSADTLQTLRDKRINEIYLPGFPLPENVEPVSDFSCTEDADYTLFVVPSLHFRSVFLKFLPHLREKAVLISSIKGMEPDTSKRISEVVEELSGDRFLYSVLSGPSFAVEVAQHHPTAVVIGSSHKDVGKEIQKDLSSKSLRLYYNSDVLGIEIGASVKNIIAIAAGVVSGLGYGYNTLSGLITRGLVEMNRFAVKLGAQPTTLAGLAGIGDLILTCTGHLSRNRQVGMELGRGKKIADITGQTRMVAEGVRTVQGIYALAQKMQVAMPITEQVYRVIYENQDPRSAILELMSRELKEE